AKVFMHAMGAMPAMGGPARVEPVGPGRWRADFALEMGGTWQVEITAHRPGGETLTAEGSLTVGTPGLRLAAAAAAELAERPASAEFRYDPARLRQLGIGSEPARREALTATVRAVGRVVLDETTLHDVAV